MVAAVGVFSSAMECFSGNSVGEDTMQIFNPDSLEVVRTHRQAHPVRIPENILRAVEAALAVGGGPVGAHRTKYPVRTSAPITLREYYQQPGGPSDERKRRIAAGRNKTGTAEKDLSAIACWEQHSGNPAVEEITTLTAGKFIATALQHCRRATVKGYVGHLRWLLNQAKRQGLNTQHVDWEFPKVSRRTEQHETHRATLTYEVNGDILQTLSDIYSHLQGEEIRTAFVIGATFGPRTEDLLTLNWSQVDTSGERPVMRYIAEKTGSFHVCPLPDWLCKRLDAYRKRSQLLWPDSGQLFPTLIGHKTQEPKKSRQARRTVAALRAAAIAAGVDFGDRSKAEQRPFQVLRATCNERYERHARRAGEWLLGHGMSSVNRQSYQNPGQEIYDAVNTLPTPEVFKELSG